MYNNCRICGLYLEESPWGDDNQTPNYEICPCCGVEYGNEDYDIASIRKYRDHWIKTGAEWFRPKEKPDNWNLNAQLENIPSEYK